MWTISNKCYHSDRVDSNMIDFNTTQGSLRDNGTTEKVFKCSQATWNIWETHSVKADNFRVEVVSTRTTCLCYFVTTLCQKMDPNVWRHFCLTSGWPLGLHQPFDFELFRNFRSVKGLLNLLIRNKESVLWDSMRWIWCLFFPLVTCKSQPFGARLKSRTTALLQIVMPCCCYTDSSEVLYLQNTHTKKNWEGKLNIPITIVLFTIWGNTSG